MLISIIIPIYNVELYIERCLLSALNQTYRDIEIILVDDCGQDNSMVVAQQIVKNHPNGHKVLILKHEHNRGLSAARNTGIDASSGEYVYYLDSDDEITPNCIEVLLNMSSKYQWVEVVQGNTMTIPKPPIKKDWRNIHTKNFPEFVNSNKWIYSHFYGMKKDQIPVNAWNKLIKRKFIVDNDLFFQEGLIHEDEMWMFFMVKKLNSIAFTSEYTYIHYITYGSIMQSGNNYKNIQSTYIILRKIFDDFDDLHYEYFKKKYLRVLYYEMCSINLNTDESELYHSYKTLVKNIIRQSFKRGKIFFALPIYILLMPQFFYKSFVCKQFFRLFTKL